MKKSLKKGVVLLPGILLLSVLLLQSERIMCQKRKSIPSIYVKDSIYTIKSGDVMRFETELIYNGKDTMYAPFYLYQITDSSKKEYLLVDFITHYKKNGQKEYKTFNNTFHYTEVAAFHYNSLGFTAKKKMVVTYIRRGFLFDPGEYKVKLVLTYYLANMEKLKHMIYSNWIYITVE